MNPTPSTDIGPGFLGFVAFTFLALALWFLMRDMTGRMRRMSYRERDRLAAADEAQDHTGAEPDEGGQGDTADPDGAEPGASAAVGGDGAAGPSADVPDEGQAARE